MGFSAGQVQLIDPIKKETSKLFNEDVSPGRVCLRLNLNRFNLVQSVSGLLLVIDDDIDVLYRYDYLHVYVPILFTVIKIEVHSSLSVVLTTTKTFM